MKIEAVKAVPFARSSEEMAKRYEEQKAKGNATGLTDPADIIPPNAQGNNTRIEIIKGPQTHHFHLKKPSRSERGPLNRTLPSRLHRMNASVIVFRLEA